MERLQQLISKLNDQSQQNETALQMLVTIKQIEAELTHIHTVAVTGRKTPGVSVVMPSMNFGSRVREEELPQTAVMVSAREPKSEPLIAKTAIAEAPESEVLETVFQSEAREIPASHKPWMGDPLTEVPTLSHQPNNRELNDLLGSANASINDKLKPGPDLSWVLPSKHLR